MQTLPLCAIPLRGLRSAALCPTQPPCTGPRAQSREGSEKWAENRADAGCSGCGTWGTESAPLLRGLRTGCGKGRVCHQHPAHSWLEGHSVVEQPNPPRGAGAQPGAGLGSDLTEPGGVHPPSGQPLGQTRGQALQAAGCAVT